MRFPDPEDSMFREKYLMKEVLRKYPGFDLGIDTNEVAIQAYMAQEAINKTTNDRVGKARPDDSGVCEVIRLAGRKCVSILGPFKWSEFVDGVRHGPGSTATRSMENSDLWSKLSEPPNASPDAYGLVQAVYSMTPGWAYSSVKSGVVQNPALVPFEELLVVPKNAKTGRVIKRQPSGNVALQLSIGTMLRRRLWRHGVDLNDQSRNQRLAKQGSIDGHLATIDLSAASDSLTSSLVWELIGNHPGDTGFKRQDMDPLWFRVMEALRVSTCRVNNKDASRKCKLLENEQWSAMGNGYTFELESMIFFALAHSACVYLGLPTEHISVYGDDIIVPSEAVDLLVKVFDWVGFRVNKDKSFWGETPFRESCGEHYRSGANVTPFYLDYVPQDDVGLVVLANNIKKWAALDYGYDARVKDAYDYVLSRLSAKGKATAIPPNWHLPEEDLGRGLVKDFDEARPSPVFQGMVMIKGRQYGGYPLGYRLKTVLRIARKPLSGGEPGLTLGLYQSQVVKFTPPPVKVVRRVPAGFMPVDRRPVIEIDLFKAPKLREPEYGTVKQSLTYRQGVTPEWPSHGPWVG
jgi:hypothetical protein